MTRFFLWLAAAMVLAGPALAAGAEDITLDHGAVWQTGKAGVTTEGFFDIHNTGSSDDVLTAWDCPDSDSSELVGADGKKLSSLTIPAGQTVSMSKAGVHLVLPDVHYQVEYGSLLPCALTFQNAGDIGGFLNAVPAP